MTDSNTMRKISDFIRAMNFDLWVIGLLFFFCHLSLTTANAQTFTQQLQKQRGGEGKVTLHQSAAIDRLVNGSKAVAEKPKTTTAKSATTTKKTEHKPQQQPITKATHTSDTVSTPVGQPQLTDSTASKARRTYRTNGYRVQVFAGGNSRHDRQKAEQMGNQLRTLFPTEQVYVHFYSPRWICRIGNYRTKEEARQMKNSLSQLGFGTTTIVKGKITLPY